MDILILSSHFDGSTSWVIQYLLHARHNVYRINGEDTIRELNIKIGGKDDQVMIDNKLHLNQIDTYWYRRGDFNLESFRLDSPYYEAVAQQISEEKRKTRAFLYRYLSHNKRGISTIDEDRDHNKLEHLVIASKVGLNVPNTLVSNRKAQIYDFLASDKTYITKAISNCFELIDEKGRIQAVTTKLISKKEINALGEIHLPLLIQEYIPKKYELRVFFLGKKLFPMAIFSQQNQKTRIDYRNYDRKTPNRTIPYLLPTKINEKVIAFITKIGWVSGSIDFIVDSENNFYFLEVNAIGQFGWLSHSCNYYLEKEIAKFLTKKRKI